MFRSRADMPYEDELSPKREAYSRPPRSYRMCGHWYELPGGIGRYERVPSLKLTGRWLRDAGFVVGAKVAVEVKEGSITLTVIETPPPVAPKVPRKVQQELAHAARLS